MTASESIKTKMWSEQEGPGREGYVVIGRREGGNAFSAGFCEGSFGYEASAHRVRFWWTGTAHSNFGTTHELNGKDDAERHAKIAPKYAPGVAWEVWNVADAACPVEFDWDNWRAAKQPSDKTLSGVVDKYGARNIPFRMKADPDYERCGGWGEQTRAKAPGQ